MNVTEKSLPTMHGSISTQLLRHHERALHYLQLATTEVDSPVTQTLVERLRKGATTDVEAGIAQVVEKLEAAIHSMQYCQSELRKELAHTHEAPLSRDRERLPGALARFVAERDGSPGFTWKANQDPVRGWSVHWKQMTGAGTVRGAGKLYERPHAWVED